MAYKFQLGDARMSGSLTQEEGITVDSGGLTITAGGLNLDAGGADFNNSGLTNAGAMSGVSTLDASGLASLDGGIDVSDKFTVAGATGNVSGAVGSFHGLTATSLDLQGGGMADAGNIAGATAVSASGQLSGMDGDFEGSVDALGGFNASGGNIVAATGNLVASAGSVSGSTGLAGLGITLASTANIGVSGDTDLMGLSADSVTVNGAFAADSAEINGTLSCDTSFTIDTVTLDATELGYLDGVSAGTVAASKALVVDASRDLGSGVDGINNLFLDGNLDADGDLSVDGAATFNGNMTMGNAAADRLIFSGNVSSSFVPSEDSAWDLGSDSNRWSTIYVDSIVGASVAWDVVVCDSGNTISASAELAIIRQGDGITVNLPAAVAGRNIRVKLSSSVGDVLIAPQSNELIDGSGDSVRLESTGSAVTFAGQESGGWVIL